MKSTTTYTTMMRVTPDGRPFAKDLFDIFAAMIFQIKIGEHKSLFRTYHACFTTEAMVDILDHLQFTHVLRQPDPNEPSRQLETKTITTFSMTSTMAKQLGQHFLTARLIESATDSSHKTMKDRGLWTITSKGKWMVYDFAQRGHISWSQQTATSAILKTVADRKVMVLYRLDTPVPDGHHSNNNSNSDEEETNGRFKNRFLNLKLSSKKKKPVVMDVISFDRKNMMDAFKLMMDHLETSSLLADDVGGIATDKISDYTDTFYGYHVVEFVAQYMTVVSQQEAESVASEFVLCGWICQIIDKSDRSSFNRYNKDDLTFKSQRNVLYALTKRGKEVLGWDNNNKNNNTNNSKSVHKNDKTNNNNNNSNNNPTPVSTPPPSSITVNTLDSSSSISSHSASNQKPTSTSNISLSKRNSCSQINNKNHLHQQLYFSSDTLSTTSSSASSQFSHHTEESELQHHEQYQNNNNNNNNNNHDNQETRQFHRSMLPSFGSNYQPSMQSVHYLRLKPILEDSLLRMYFRDLLKQNYCEENLQFWLDYKNMLQHYELEQKRENRILSECYAMYTTYLAPDAPKELNIDHSLHQDITSFIRLAFNVYRHDGNTTNSNSNSSSTTATSTNNTKTNNTPTSNSNSNTSTSVTGYNIMQQQQHLPFFYTPTHPSQEQQSIIVVNGNRTQCLKTLLQMYDRVHDQICKNMAEDSLPRFLKSPRYIEWQQKQQSKRKSADNIPKSSLLSTSPPSPYPTKSTSTSSHASHGSLNKKTFDANDDEEDLLNETNHHDSSSLPLDEDEVHQKTKGTLEELQKLTLTGITTTMTTTTNTLNAPPSPLN